MTTDAPHGLHKTAEKIHRLLAPLSPDDARKVLASAAILYSYELVSFEEIVRLRSL